MLLSELVVNNLLNAEEELCKHLVEIGAKNKMQACNMIMDKIIECLSVDIVGLKALGKKEVVSVCQFSGTYTGTVYGYYTCGDLIIGYYDSNKKKNCLVSVKASDRNRKLTLALPSSHITVAGAESELDRVQSVSPNTVSIKPMSHYGKYCMRYSDVVFMLKSEAVQFNWCIKRICDLVDSGVIGIEEGKRYIAELQAMSHK